MNLLIIGSIALDSVENPFGKVEEVLGGSAVYASIAASCFSKNISIVGVIGNDFPNEYLELLKTKNIDIKGVKIANGKTFRWKGKYENLNEAITLQTSLNVFANFSPKIPEKQKLSKYILLENIDPDLQISVIDQLKKPKIIAADTMNFWIKSKNKSLKKLLKRIDILFINEDEIRMLTDSASIFDAAEKTFKIGPKIIVIKRGEYGSITIAKNFLFFVPVFPLKNAIDTTGAGDSFAGGFMGFLTSEKKLDEQTLKKAALYGTITASFDIESFSLDSLKKMDKEKIETRVNLLKKYTQF